MNSVFSNDLTNSSARLNVKLRDITTVASQAREDITRVPPRLSQVSRPICMKKFVPNKSSTLMAMVVPSQASLLGLRVLAMAVPNLARVVLVRSW
jgi:hypothetical protein